MKKYSKAKNNVRHMAVWVVLGLLFCTCQPIAFAFKEITVITLNTSLWQLIEITQSRPALSLENVEADLGQKLIEQIEHSNEFVRFFIGRPVQLLQGLMIGEIDLSLPRRPSGATRGALSLEMAGECITLQQVKQHFPDLTITSIPRGRSLEESVTYTAITAWGKVSFSFREKKPDCLAYVNLRPVIL